MLYQAIENYVRKHVLACSHVVHHTDSLKRHNRPRGLQDQLLHLLQTIPRIPLWPSFHTLHPSSLYPML